MPLSLEFQKFVERWRSKADGIELNDLAAYFDKFTALFVVFNHLYSEATFTLAREGKIRINEKLNFPDSKAAKVYAADFLGEEKLRGLLEAPEMQTALQDLDRILDEHVFNVLLKGARSEPDRESDMELLRNLRSSDVMTRGKAILQFLYAVRCNTVHGSKAFQSAQANVLRPCITLLSFLNDQLLDGLQRRG